MGRAVTRRLAAIAGVGVLLACLTAVNPRLREHAESVATLEGASAQVATLSSEARHTSRTTYIALKELSLAHAPLTIFTVASFGLVLFMLRS
jgi:hypothetical protein